MTASENTLAELHRVHQRLSDLKDELERGPRQLKARVAHTQQKLSELEAQRQQQKQLRMLADQKSLQLKSNEAKIEELKARLNQAQSNREFDVLKAQIEADKVANSVLEDEILNTLERVDMAQAAVKKLEEQVAASKEEEARFAAALEKAQPGLLSEIAALKEQLAQAESKLPPEVRVPYERLVLAHGAGALAQIEGDTCGACYVKLPTQHAVQVRAGQITLCKTCGRLLYAVAE